MADPQDVREARLFLTGYGVGLEERADGRFSVRSPAWQNIHGIYTARQLVSLAESRGHSPRPEEGRP